MSTLTDTPIWSDNEVLVIPADAAVEGAAPGASYGGLGIDNYPHQQLANRTAYLLDLIGNMTKLTAGVGDQRGWIVIPFVEGGVTRRNLLVQWGTNSAVMAANTTVGVSTAWPRTFAVLWHVVVGPVLWSIQQDLREFIVQYSPGESDATQGVFRARSTTSARHDFSWIAIGTI